jgi:hypothetical protein
VACFCSGLVVSPGKAKRATEHVVATVEFMEREVAVTKRMIGLTFGVRPAVVAVGGLARAPYVGSSDTRTVCCCAAVRSSASSLKASSTTRC